jgi:hypothetical protein
MTMRKIDPRVKVSRRRFLQSTAAAAPAAGLAAGGVMVDATAAWAQAQALSPHAMATLTLMARDIYPHDQLGDAYYRQAVAHWDSDAAADEQKRSLIAAGVVAADAKAKAHFGTDYLHVPAESDRVAILKTLEAGPFFKAVRADLVVSLYNQKPVWAKFGYEGASAQYGGYLHRGFADIDWLPVA